MPKVAPDRQGAWVQEAEAGETLDGSSCHLGSQEDVSASGFDGPIQAPLLLGPKRTQMS